MAVRVRTLLTVLIVVPLMAAWSALAGASGAPTGNAAVIALYGQAVAVMNARPAIVETTRGQYYWGYSGSGWRLDLNSATAPYSYERHVNLVQTDAVSGGKVAWELNEFACPTAGGCGTQGSLDIYGTASAVYWGTTSSTAAGLPACWNVAAGQTAWMLKGWSPGWRPFSETTGAGFTAQHYVSVAHRGGRDVFTSTFKLRSSATPYTEVDTTVAATKAFVGTTYHVGARPGHPAYSYSIAYSYPAAAAAPPTLTMCSAGG